MSTELEERRDAAIDLLSAIGVCASQVKAYHELSLADRRGWTEAANQAAEHALKLAQAYSALCASPPPR